MQKRRYISLILVFALVLSMFVGLSNAQVSAASTKYEVPSKVVHYSNEAEDDLESVDKAVWKKAGSDSFKYNAKGYVTAQGKWKTKWALKGSKRVKAKTGSKTLRAVAKSVYKKGKLTSIAFTQYNKKGKVVGKGTEKYSRTKASKGWIAKIAGNKGGTKYTITYTYKFHSNGMPKTIKEVEKAYGGKFATIYSFNDKGLVTKVKTKYETTTFKYKYDENGRAAERYTYTDGMLMFKDVLVYSGDSTTEKKTFVGAINTNNMCNVSSFVRDALAPSYPWLAK